jgi:RNA polymerase sigma-70 factor (ECF subfamily)
MPTAAARSVRASSFPIPVSSRPPEDGVERTAQRRHDLTSLVLAEKNYFMRTAASILRNAADAEDVVHTAFCSAWKAIATFRGESSLKTWFTRIVTNTALMALRKSNRTVFLEDNPEYLQAFEHSTRSFVEDPERIAVRRETLRLVERHIESLPKETRIVLTLHFSHDCSIEAIGQLRGKSRPSVVAHLHRGKALLRKKVRHMPAASARLNAAALH